MIACGIYQDELEHVLAANGCHREIVWLDAGLDNNLEMLEAKLDEVIARQRDDGKTDVRLMFGCSCLPHMADFAKNRQVAVMPAKNCIAAMIGDGRKLELEKDKTMVVTPAWVRKMWLAPDGGDGAPSGQL
ncbi:hypothetical protein C4J81_15850 [Deltaproteobacteria bacterium Smac51]|nr:hypothetical protein C4J81_15850 [Deltaproteobacteria bacterium Smac51]